jgi:hypothetical protein
VWLKASKVQGLIKLQGKQTNLVTSIPDLGGISSLIRIAEVKQRVKEKRLKEVWGFLEKSGFGQMWGKISS